MRRRTVLWSPLLFGVRHVWDSFKGGASPTILSARDTGIPEPDDAVLENTNHKLRFDRRTGRLTSFRAKSAPEQEFIVSNGQIPVFVIQYLTAEREFRQIVSSDARESGISLESTGQSLTFIYSGLSGMDLAATVKIRMADGQPSSSWSISIHNGAGLLITDVQFPFVIARYQLGGRSGAEALIRPLGTGRFWQAPKPQDLEPDSPHAWQFRPENTDTSHYPGLTFAQFLAYYNDLAGLYVSCQDNSGAIKLIKPVHNPAGGIRLGFAHVGDWPVNGDRDLGYNVVLQAFRGDRSEEHTSEL